MLVRTGKYRREDEEQSTVHPDLVVDNLRELVDMLVPST